MLLSPRRTSTLGDLLRLVAVWLALALMVQGLAAVHARALGPAHQHRADSPSGLFAHRHHHDETARHQHAEGDDTVLAMPAATEDGLDAAAAALTAVFAMLMGGAGTVRQGIGSGRVWRAALAWSRLVTTIEPLLKPPKPPRTA